MPRKPLPIGVPFRTRQIFFYLLRHRSNPGVVFQRNGRISMGAAGKRLTYREPHKAEDAQAEG
jgi:hypothetical protein